MEAQCRLSNNGPIMVHQKLQVLLRYSARQVQPREIVLRIAALNLPRFFIAKWEDALRMRRTFQRFFGKTYRFAYLDLCLPCFSLVHLLQILVSLFTLWNLHYKMPTRCPSCGECKNGCFSSRHLWKDFAKLVHSAYSLYAIGHHRPSQRPIRRSPVFLNSKLCFI